MPDTSPPQSDRRPTLAEDVGFLAMKAGARSVAEANRRLAEIGLRVRPFAVLALACTGAPRTQKEIAEYLMLDPSQVVTLLDQLERDHLVRRIPDPSDRRARLVTATAVGQSTFERAHALTEAANDLTLTNLTPSERQTLLELLLKIV